MLVHVGSSGLFLVIHKFRLNLQILYQILSSISVSCLWHLFFLLHSHYLLRFHFWNTVSLIQILNFTHVWKVLNIWIRRFILILSIDRVQILRINDLLLKQMPTFINIFKFQSIFIIEHIRIVILLRHNWFLLVFLFIIFDIFKILCILNFIWVKLILFNRCSKCILLLLSKILVLFFVNFG